MNCINHIETGAIAACVHCGVGVCPSCRMLSTSGRSVCSEKCSEQLSAAEEMLSAPINKIGSSLRTTGWIYGVFGVAGILSGFAAIATKNTSSGLSALIIGALFLFGAFKNFQNARDA